MKPKITFHDLKFEIPWKTGEVARYYREITYITCDKPDCVIYCSDGAAYKAAVTLKYLLDNLPEAFFRCNHHTIINICRYKEFQIDPTAFVMMENDTEIPLSLRKITAFKKHKYRLRRISSPCTECYSCGEEDCASRSAFCRRHKMQNKEMK